MPLTEYESATRSFANMSTVVGQVGGTIVPGANFDPQLVVKLALRPRDHDPDTFSTVMSTLMSQSSSIYDRGLAAWSIGRLLQINAKLDTYYLKKQILDQSGVVMDALVDVIGEAKEIAAAARVAGSRLDASSTLHSSTSYLQSSKRASGAAKKNSPSKRVQEGHSQKQKQNQQQSSSPSLTSHSPVQDKLEPSINDCNRISKNCSLIIIMLSNFVADVDNDPYTFQAPSTPLLRMAATPEVINQSIQDGESSSIKRARHNKRKRAKRRKQSPSKSVSPQPNNAAAPSPEGDQEDLKTFFQVAEGNSHDFGGDDDSTGSSPSPEGKVRTYFRKTDHKIPDLRLSEYMATPQISDEDLGDEPRPRKTMNPSAIAGELTTTGGAKMITLGKRVDGPQPRTSVLYDDEPAWDVPVAATKSGDFLAKDVKLGYQVPRLYLAQDRPHTSNHRPTMPSPRPSPTHLAKRPYTSDQIRSEYNTIEAKYKLDEIRSMTPSQTGWYSLPPDSEWQAKAFPDDARPVWTPSKGIDPDQLPKAWGTTNFNSTSKRADSPSNPKKEVHDGNDGAVSSPAKKKAKTLLKQKLAGDSLSYESRKIQRARDMMSAAMNFAFFPPNIKGDEEPQLVPSAPVAAAPSLTRNAAEPKDDDEADDYEDGRGAAVSFSPTASRAHSPTKPMSSSHISGSNRPVSPYELDSIVASMPQFIRGTMVELDDFRKLQLTTAQSKRASKRADLASAEAKEEYRRRRLQAIVTADDKDLPPAELSKIARRDHTNILSILTNQSNTLKVHSQSLQNKIDASIQVQNKALPLHFLFTIEGGAEYCRARLKAAFQFWIHGFESAQKTVALALWKMAVDSQVRKEKHALYREQAGRRKLKVIINEIDLRLFRRTFDRWNNTVSYLIYVERDAAATKIQAQVYRHSAMRTFLWMHDSCPIGGPLSDIYLKPIRKNVKFCIYPRVRSERRQFWSGALLIQTRYRMIVERTHFIHMKEKSVLIQSVWRMWVDRKEYMKVRYYAIILESMARMIVKKWQHRRLLKASRVAQRIFRGYRAKLRFYILLKAYRQLIEKRLSMPPRIQRAWRCMIARRKVQALRNDKEELYDAAVRLQCFWYKHQGEFPRFVLLGVLRETDKLEQEFEKKIKLYGKIAHAKKIQRTFKEHLYKRYVAGAVRIQCLARNAAGTNLVNKLRLEKWANRKLRHWARGMMKKRNKAATKIAFAFYKAKSGRFLQHLITMNNIEERKAHSERRAKLNGAASVLQAIVHGVWTRRMIKKTKAAIQIERTARGFLGRRRALHRLRDLQYKIASNFISRMTHEAQVKEIYRIKKLKKESATLIGKTWRAFIVKLRLWRTNEAIRERVEAATCLQRKYRKMLDVKRARARLLYMQRRLSNPFRDLVNISALVKNCFDRANLLFNPEKVLCGASLSTFCFRLGIMGDVMPILLKNQVSTTEQLYRMSDEDLQRIGVREEVKGDRQFGIVHAATVRQTILTLARNTNVSDMTAEERAVHGDYNLLSEDPKQKSVEVRRIFESCYGDRFAARAANFAVGDVLKAPLAGLQLRRFFAVYQTPSKAKDNIKALLKFDVSEEEKKFDASRIEKSMDIMLYAAETIRDIVKNYPGLYYRIHHDVDIIESDMQLKKRENRGHPSALQIRTHRKREKQGCDVLFKLLNDMKELDEAARKVQNAARGFNASRIMNLVREGNFVKKVHAAYLHEKTNNHVKDIWKEDRRKEEEEYQRKYEEWQKEEERKSIEFMLKDVLREGWREDWRQSEQDNDEGEWYLMYVKEVSRKVKREVINELLERVEKPLYTYEEWMKVLVIQRLGRIYLARTMTKRIRRERLRKEKEEAEKKKWNDLQKQRQQLVTLKFDFDVVTMEDVIGDDFDPDCICCLAEEDEIGVHKEEDTSRGSNSGEPKYIYDDPSEDAKDEFLVELESLVDTETTLEIGSTVQGRFQGGDIYYSGTIFQVNPTEYISPQGIKWYPKNTFGILYDDGDYEPAVHRDDIRVLKLKEGMKVEAKYGGHDAFFSGIVSATNTRGGKVLSYAIDYDDGTKEKAVRRSRIRVPDDIVAENDKRIKTLAEQHESLVKRKSEMRQKQIKKWFDKCDAIDNVLEEYRFSSGFDLSFMDKDAQIDHVTGVYLEKWGKKEVATNCTGREWGHNTRDNAPNFDEVDLPGMLAAGKKLFDLIRPSVRCRSTLRYTKISLPYGWHEKKNHRGHIVGYTNNVTGQQLGVEDCPCYSFQEELACRRLQSQWRALAGKRAFQKKLKNESILGVLKLSVKEATSHCWLNYGDEGMTLDMWLARCGLQEFYRPMMETYSKEARKKGGTDRRASKVGLANDGRRRGSSIDADLATRRSSRFGGTDDLRKMSSVDFMGVGSISSAGSGFSRRLSKSVAGSEAGLRRKSITSEGTEIPRSRGRQRSILSSDSKIEAGGLRASISRRRSSSAHSQGSDRESNEGSRRGSTRGGEAEKSHDTVLNLSVFLRKCDNDSWLASMGFKKERDRNIIKDMKRSTAEAKMNFGFLNYYIDEHDPRSMTHCIQDSKDTLYKLVLRRYKNNPQRVAAIVEEMCKSKFPVTVGQVKRFFSKYEGKPAMAQENVRKELVDVKTTSLRAEEKMSYDVLKSGISRASVLLNNLGVAELTSRLTDAVEAAESVIKRGTEEEKKRLHQEKEKDKEKEKDREKSAHAKNSSPPAPSRNVSMVGLERRQSHAAISVTNSTIPHSGHEAKGLLILRRDAVQLVINWWNSTLLLQRRFRGHRQRNIYRSMREDRKVAATKLQGFVRTHIIVKKLKRYLQKQYNSDIEQLWSDEVAGFYWYNKKTTEAMWEEPGVPYRPMIRDRFTQQLMQAWPILDRAIVIEPEAPPGICMICKEEDATRMCNQCVQSNPKITWGDGYLHTCFICYSTLHNETAEMRKHTFTVTKASVARKLKCCMCGNLSTRRCRGMVIPDEVKDRLVTVIVESFDKGKEAAKEGADEEVRPGALDQIEEEEFISVVKNNLQLGGLFSNERIKSMYVECRGKFKDKRSNSEIWKRFQEHLNAMHEECNENYCAGCWEESHKRGKRAKHQWVGYQEGCQVCVECEAVPAEKFCVVCQDYYCSDCAKDTHRYGKKHRHGFEEIKEQLEPQQVYCVTCGKRAGTVLCSFCKEMTCDSCSLFSHPDECSVRTKLMGGRTKECNAIACAVCQKPPDMMCLQCGDVYCSVKWMGNPGCFRKTHMKGHRKDHTLVPYTFLEDRRKHEEEVARKAAEEAESLAQKQLSERLAKEELERAFKEKASARGRKLEGDAQAEFEERHRNRLLTAATKKRFKFLPRLFSGSSKVPEKLTEGLTTVEKMQAEFAKGTEKNEKERMKLAASKMAKKRTYQPPVPVVQKPAQLKPVTTTKQK